MLQHRFNFLFVVDSQPSDPSLAVFGECSGPLSTRPFLGRVRPPLLDTQLTRAFAHPYGVDVAGDESLHVSSQDGGAVVSVDPVSSRCTL